LGDQLGQLFQAFGGVFESSAQWFPPVDLYDNNDTLTIKAELPGLKKEDIGISLQDGVLVLSGERRDTRNRPTEPASERDLCRFQRSISLPYKVNAGAIKASYVDGILTVELPKAEEAKPKQIKIEFA
jgi:HSP20 family protein